VTCPAPASPAPIIPTFYSVYDVVVWVAVRVEPSTPYGPSPAQLDILGSMLRALAHEALDPDISGVLSPATRKRLQRLAGLHHDAFGLDYLPVGDGGFGRA
jgi:hypothetical protein